MKAQTCARAGIDGAIVGVVLNFATSMSERRRGWNPGRPAIIGRYWLISRGPLVRKAADPKAGGLRVASSDDVSAGPRVVGVGGDGFIRHSMPHPSRISGRP